MKKLFIITDYKGLFGSRWDAYPYRSGLDLSILKDHFFDNGFDVILLNFSEVVNNDEINSGDYAIYTSTEDIDFKYKDFIDDAIFFLEKKGVKVIPKYEYLKATNNKVSMELLRKLLLDNDIKFNSNVYGTFEEFKKNISNKHLVFKKPQGAMSRGVFLSTNKFMSYKVSKYISKTKKMRESFKEFVRSFIHKGYIKESHYRNKFVVQSFIPNLKNDFKILIFGDKYFIFSRPVKSNDFRASGSGYENYSFGSKCKYPEGIFSYAESVFKKMDLPHLSLDIAYDGNYFYLLEFQGMHFGTIGIVKSDIYFKNQGNSWMQFKNDISVEDIYVKSITNFIKKI